ncbi:hypothetical protein QAD02_020795 [Eretmocerus hayati]|uniref:Uncharacterized protein n=1 Tax=Eretmocerus hayati TaxID=131215 RepID=A0ACC2PRM2_9HYME|nr:hypothetical protein QAD02_020795 [Eretmocerus hayati]
MSPSAYFHVRASIGESDDQDEAVSNDKPSPSEKPHAFQFRNLQRAQPSFVASTQEHKTNRPAQQSKAFRTDDLQRSQYFGPSQPVFRNHNFQRSQYFGASQPGFRNDNFQRSQYFGTSQPSIANGTYQSYSSHPERWLQFFSYTHLPKPQYPEATQPHLALGAKQSAVTSPDQRPQPLKFANLKRPQIIHPSGASQAGSQRFVILKPSTPSHPPFRSRLLSSTFDTPVNGHHDTQNAVRSNSREQHRFSTFQEPVLPLRQQSSHTTTSSCGSHNAQMSEVNSNVGAYHEFASLQRPHFLARQSQSTLDGQKLVSLQGPQILARQTQSKLGGQTFNLYNSTGRTLNGNKSITNKAHEPGIDLDEQEFEIRAVELRLQAAKLDLDRLKKRYAAQKQSQEIQPHQESLSNHNQLEEGSQGSKEPAKRKSNNKGKNSNIYGGYAYTPDGPPNPKTGTQYLSCIQNNGRKCKITGEILKTSCLGRAIKYSDGRLMFTGKHTCDEVPLRERRRDSHNALCDAARNETGFLKEIYDRLAPK